MSIRAAAHLLRRLALAELAIFLAGLVVLWPTTHSLMIEWENTDATTYTHGYLIAAIALWLLVRNAASREYRIGRGGALVWISIIVASMAWLITLRAGIQIGHQLLLPVLIWLAIRAALGPAIAWRSAFPLAFLYFAIPFWGAINELLQSTTTLVVGLLLQVSGVTAYVVGNLVHLPQGTFEIAGGCSGLHFFIVALAIGALYGELDRDRLGMRLQLLVLAALTALLTNWIRVYVIIVAGYLTDMQHYLVRVSHYKFGWVVFAVMLLLYFLIARRLPLRQADGDAHSSLAEHSRRTVWPAVLASLAALAVGPVWEVASPVRPALIKPGAVALPENPAGWSGPHEANAGAYGTDWSPVFAGADYRQMGAYRRDGRRVEAFVAAYAFQQQGKELVGYDNSLAGKQPKSGQAFVMRHVYRIGRLHTPSGVMAQLGYAVQSLGGTPLSSIVALRAACTPDCVSASTALDELMQALEDGHS